MEQIADLSDKAIANQERFMKRGSKNRPATKLLEGAPAVFADGHSKRRICRDGLSAVPAGGVSIQPFSTSKYVNRENAMLVEVAQAPRGNHFMLRHACNDCKVRTEFRIGNFAYVFAQGIHTSGREVDTHTCRRGQCLRGLRKNSSSKLPLEIGGIENAAEFFPFHTANHLLLSECGQSKSTTANFIALVKHVKLAIEGKNVRVADHLRVPASLGNVYSRAFILP
jgi:hypothetical protein